MQSIHQDIFKDSQIALSHKRLIDLKKSYYLFLLLLFPFLVKIGSILLKMKFIIRFFKKIIKKTIFQEFCGGESLESCKKVSKTLSNFNIQSILAYSVEQNSKISYDIVANILIKTIAHASRDSNVSFSVFKISGLTSFKLLEKVHKDLLLSSQEQNEYNFLKQRVKRICQTAYDHKVPVLIDAEETWIQKPISLIADEMMQMYNKKQAIVYQTFQMYLQSGLKDLKTAHIKAVQHQYYLGAKLVRGAYLEKERHQAKAYNYDSPIHTNKQACDEAYNKGIYFCINNLQQIWLFLGTHNELSNIYALTLMQKYNYKPQEQRIHFCQLYGMSDKISFRLGELGYNISKYIPFGPIEDVVPYLIRRLEENSSIAKQSSRELRLIKDEIKRRNK